MKLTIKDYDHTIFETILTLEETVSVINHIQEVRSEFSFVSDEEMKEVEYSLTDEEDDDK